MYCAAQALKGGGVSGRLQDVLVWLWVTGSSSCLPPFTLLAHFLLLLFGWALQGHEEHLTGVKRSQVWWWCQRPGQLELELRDQQL
jgi:hypothetical protein